MLNADAPGSLGIAFRTRSSTAASLGQSSSDAGRSSGRQVVTKGGQATSGSEPFAAAQLTGAGTSPPTATPADQLSIPIPALSGNTGKAGLTLSQRGELELAKARADRAAAGRKAGPGASGGGGGAKRGRGGGSAGEASVPVSEDDDGGEHSDGELELSRLTPEEQERLLSARLAGGGTSDKDARRLKRQDRQARERKKQYVQALEEQIRDQTAHMGLMEKRLEELEEQNTALRNIIRTMRGFADNAAPGAGPASGPRPAGQHGTGNAGGGGAVAALAAGPVSGPPWGPAAGQGQGPERPAEQAGGAELEAAHGPEGQEQEPPAECPVGVANPPCQAEHGLEAHTARLRAAPAARSSRVQLVHPHPHPHPYPHPAAASGAGGGVAGVHAPAGVTPQDAGVVPGWLGPAPAAAAACLSHGSLRAGGGAAGTQPSSMQQLMRPGLRQDVGLGVGPRLGTGSGPLRLDESELGDAGVVPLSLEVPDYLPDL
ncbi:hypothetical protein GPECTOR_4g557 [Gonium pectorale]|uniref:BZIP domain-containing protein n=1 Tax=Gonium pectorale TaxID=33097 RepID=A0A150GXR6_GONPE|nr:hypothetical protein GPECTOR_4g557 [Gonium pectorale]|eukprot:KXZ54492.1 hypothetical protein GPECTOR_4g557 [Gonium pectorale]